MHHIYVFHEPGEEAAAGVDLKYFYCCAHSQNFGENQTKNVRGRRNNFLKRISCQLNIFNIEEFDDVSDKSAHHSFRRSLVMVLLLLFLSFSLRSRQGSPPKA